MVKEFTNPPATTTANDARLDAYDDMLQTVTGDATGITATNINAANLELTGQITLPNNMVINQFNSSGDPLIRIGLNGTADLLHLRGNASQALYWGNPSIAELGLSFRRWTTIYSVNALNTSSDERKKKNIQKCNLGMNFIKRLKPVCYEYDVDKDGHTRLGFLAQDVKKALKAYGNMEDNALLREDENEEDPENPWLSMAYTELLAPMVSAMQDLEKEVSKLKKEVDSLKKDKKK